MSKLAAGMLSKQDQGHADSAEGTAAAAQGFGAYTSEIVEHKESLKESNWTEVTFKLEKIPRPSWKCGKL